MGIILLGAQQLIASCKASRGQIQSSGGAHDGLQRRGTWLTKLFDKVELMRLSRSDKNHTNALARFASFLTTQDSRVILVEYLEDPNVATTTYEVFNIKEGANWMDPFIAFLSIGTILDDNIESKKLCIKVARYCLINRVLYRKSFRGSYLKCWGPRKARAIMAEIHEGNCDNHAGGRSLASKMLTTGYVWSHIHLDALQYVL